MILSNFFVVKDITKWLKWWVMSSTNVPFEWPDDFTDSVMFSWSHPFPRLRVPLYLTCLHTSFSYIDSSQLLLLPKSSLFCRGWWGHQMYPRFKKCKYTLYLFKRIKMDHDFLSFSFLPSSLCSIYFLDLSKYRAAISGVLSPCPRDLTPER